MGKKKGGKIMKKFETPEMTVQEIELVDVIAASDVSNDCPTQTEEDRD